jgi:hypothetical protein
MVLNGFLRRTCHLTLTRLSSINNVVEFRFRNKTSLKRDKASQIRSRFPGEGVERRRLIVAEQFASDRVI